MRSTGFVIAVLLAAAVSHAQVESGGQRALMRMSFGKMPIHFIENNGVYPEAVKFFVQGRDKVIFFSRDAITFRLQGKEQDWAVRLAFVGASDSVNLRGTEPREALFNYFRGPRSGWRTGLKSFASIVYEDLWPGINLVYRAGPRRLKFDFIVKAGANPRLIRLRYQGLDRISITAAGAVRIETPVRNLEDEAPIGFQVVRGKRALVDVTYELERQRENGGCTARFKVGRYDPTRTLVIDPAVFIYCGYLGGALSESVVGVAVDKLGNAYVTGNCVAGARFPVRVGPCKTYSGGGDAFVAKIDRTGRKLIYCGFIGGSADDWGRGVAVDSAGCAYVVGDTRSAEQSFPVRSGPDLTFNNAMGTTAFDCFIAKVNATGSALDYCGYIGGFNSETARGVAVDALGAAYVTGATWSVDASQIWSPLQIPFPTKVGPDLTFNGFLIGQSVGGSDCFVAKVAPSGKSLEYCGYIGGYGPDAAWGIAVDHAGCAYVAGSTNSPQSTFPVKVGPGLKIAHTANTTHEDAFVAKISANGKSLAYCGYLGGVGGESAYSVAVDGRGCAYLTGFTDDSPKMPLKVGPGTTPGTGLDCFVAKVSASGSGLEYCGLIAGSADDLGFGIDVDRLGNAYVAGLTHSVGKGLPVANGPDGSPGGDWEGFVARVDATGQFLDYCGFVGGKGVEHLSCIAVTQSGSAFVAGHTGSTEASFPVLVGPDVTHNGQTDGFVAKVAFSGLFAVGTPRIGGILRMRLVATDSPGLMYQAGSSLGTGPIPIGSRRLNLSLDSLLVATVSDAWPHIFVKYRGVIGADGEAAAHINIPASTALIGIRIHTGFVTVDPRAPAGIREISSVLTTTITK